jgi:hypothetical protein
MQKFSMSVSRLSSVGTITGRLRGAERPVGYSVAGGGRIMSTMARFHPALYPGGTRNCFTGEAKQPKREANQLQSDRNVMVPGISLQRRLPRSRNGWQICVSQLRVSFASIDRLNTPVCTCNRSFRRLVLKWTFDSSTKFFRQRSVCYVSQTHTHTRGRGSWSCCQPVVSMLLMRGVRPFFLPYAFFAMCLGSEEIYFSKWKYDSGLKLPWELYNAVCNLHW